MGEHSKVKRVKQIYCGAYEVTAPVSSITYVGIGHTEGKPLAIVVATGKDERYIDGRVAEIVRAMNRDHVFGELLDAAVRVLDGLNARIEYAGVHDGQNVPVFDGIAYLHDAINRAKRASK